MNRNRFIILTAVVLLAGVAAHAATVTVQRAVRHQTMVGFGSFASISPWKVLDGPFWVDVDLDAIGAWDMLATDLSVFRTNNHFNSSVLQKLVAAGVDQFIISVWSPPAYMKDNNDVNHGGHLLPEYYDDYANYCVDFLTRFRNEVGVEALALSLQNELRFSEPYESCIYTQATYRDLLKVAGPIIDAAHPNVKLFGPEDMSQEPALLLSFVGAAESDPESAGYLDIVASHGYAGDGVTPGETGADKWMTIREFAEERGKDTWMSETSGYPDSWAGAMDVAQNIYGSLTFGKISLWTWWTLVGDLIPDGGPSSRYAVHAQYGRYIRPGAVMVECASDDAEVLATAFDDDQRSRLTLVLVNTAASAKSVVVAGDQMPAAYSLLQTTESAFTQDAGSADAGAVSLPPSSVTTLYAPVSALAASPVVHDRARRWPAARGSALYRLDGARVGAAAAGGVYLRALHSGAGVGRTEVRCGAHR